ncbi:MAG: archease [Candidatus Nanoarchaeia archaeon]|nr:archease [Candidatus Nanoarchaeia archaeon]MDD5741294.1 archease [Candidatus Nanoarchaeia archaeon]
MKFKFLEHTADIKFQAFGKSLEEVFVNAALALKEIMTRGIKVKSRINKKFEISGKNNERLLYNFLEEFLYLSDAEDFLLSKIKDIKIKNNKLIAEVIGDDAESYKFSNNVKAITYSEMFVKKEKDKYTIQVVVDV